MTMKTRQVASHKKLRPQQLQKITKNKGQKAIKSGCEHPFQDAWLD